MTSQPEHGIATTGRVTHPSGFHTPRRIAWCACGWHDKTCSQHAKAWAALQHHLRTHHPAQSA
jgi:hypothetical protein